MSTNNTSPASCPRRATPEADGLGLDDRKSIFAVVPRENYTGDSPDDWMVSCCEPSPVQLVGNEEFGTCWQWCDLPSNYTNLTSDTSILSADFMRCMTSTARATNSSYPPTALLLSAAPRAGVAGDGVLGLALVLAVAVWGLFL